MVTRPDGSRRGRGRAARRDRGARRLPAAWPGDARPGAGARVVADRSAASTCSRRPAGQPAPRPRRPLAARRRARASTRSARPATRQRRGGRRPAADRPGAAALPLGRLLPGPRRQRGRTTASATSCSACSRRPTSRSPAAATRSSATTTLAVIPQTSTIASHLPRAVGVAFAIGRAARLGLPSTWPARCDRRVLASATPRSTTPPPRARSTPPLTAHPGLAAAAAVRVRGQRLGHQRADAGRAGSHASLAGRGCGTCRRRHRPGGRVRRRRGARRGGRTHAASRRSCTCAPCARRARRHRRRGRLPPPRQIRAGPTATRCCAGRRGRGVLVGAGARRPRRASSGGPLAARAAVRAQAAAAGRAAGWPRPTR